MSVGNQLAVVVNLLEEIRANNEFRRYATPHGDFFVVKWLLNELVRVLASPNATIPRVHSALATSSEVLGLPERGALLTLPVLSNFAINLLTADGVQISTTPVSLL